MKKRVMLAMAIIMVLGSVKAMASSIDMEMAEGKWNAAEENQIMASDEMLSNDAMIENQLSKTTTAEEDAAQVKMMDTIREQIMTLAEKSKFLDEVKVGDQTVSRGQALFAAEADFSSLQSKFDMKHAKSVSKILDGSIKSLPKSK